MADLTESISAPPVREDPMRMFALAVTTYLWMINLLYLLTRGAFRSPDQWSDLYVVLLAAYGAAPEVKSMFQGGEPESEDSWQSRVRKGAPFIGLWLALLLGAGAWRIHDPACPMPPELKGITMQVIGVFFGTYALRQYRRARTRRRAVSSPPPANMIADLAAEIEDHTRRIESYLAGVGQANPKSISDATGISRRSVNRILADLTTAGRITRQARSINDPLAVFSMADNPDAKN